MKKKKFLNKMVNLVDKTLRKADNLDEQITIYWNDEDMTMSFYHDNYGFAGTYAIVSIYERYINDCDSNVKIKVKEHLLCQTFADDVASDMKMFIREKRNPIIVKTPFERTIYIDKNLEDCDELVDDELCEGCDCDKDFHTCDCPICFSDKNNGEIGTTNDVVENPFEENDDENECNNNPLDFPDIEKADLKKINNLIQPSKATCPECGSNETRKNGKKAGKQRWICKDCNRYFTGEVVS